jgi:hypothetical protein
MTAPNRSAELAAFHQQWNGGAPITDEAEKHRFTEAFAPELARGDPRWGRKARADGAGPLSKDTLGYWLGPVIPTVPTDGLLDAIDILTSWGADAWQEYPAIYARWFPVGATPDPDPEPPPPFDPALIYAELAALTELVNELFKTNEKIETRLDALEAQPVPQPQPPVTVETTRSWGHTHKVTVPR